MPLVRINLAQTASPEVVQAISNVVYDAMIDVVKVPEHRQVSDHHAPCA
jgi:4-oxalocrotonate tautomerase